MHNIPGPWTGICGRGPQLAWGKMTGEEALQPVEGDIMQKAMSERPAEHDGKGNQKASMVNGFPGAVTDS